MKVRVATYVFLKLNLWLCACALLMVFASVVALGISPAALGVGVLLPPLLFAFIYIEDRRTISPEDRFNHPHRTRLVERYERPLFYAACGALASYELILVAAVLAQPSRGLPVVLLGQLPLVVLGLYEYFKLVPAFDSLAVAATWAYVIVYTIVVTTGYPVDRPLATIFLGWFLIVFAGVESRNATDQAGDTLTEKTTLAGHLGPQHTTVLETVLKTAGVLIFYQLAGLPVTAIVLLYLLALRGFRVLTARVDDHRALPRRTGTPAIK